MPRIHDNVIKFSNYGEQRNELFACGNNGRFFEKPVYKSIILKKL